MGKAIVVFIGGKLEIVCTNKTNAWKAVEAKVDVTDLYVQGKREPWITASYGQIASRLGAEAHSCSMFNKEQTEQINAMTADDVAPRPVCRMLQMEMNYDREGNLFKSGEEEEPKEPKEPKAKKDKGDVGLNQGADPEKEEAVAGASLQASESAEPSE